MNNLVSVIVTCFNHEHYILDCLKSLIYQSYKDVQLIVIDDCSVDQSWEKIQLFKEELEQNLTEVLLIRNNINKGLVRNLNAAIDLCKGDYIKALSGDDFLEKDYLKICVEAMEKTNSVDVLFTYQKWNCIYK